MSTTPPALVPGAPRAPLPYGLFSAVALREGSGDRWEGGGVQFEELGCPPSVGVIGAPSCDEEAPTLGLPKEFEGGLPVTEASSFTVYGSYVCSPIGNGLEHAYSVAEQRLLTFEERAVEQRLWTGASVLATGDTPAAFTGLTPISTQSDLRQIIPTLEGELAEKYGSLGIIHLSRRNALLAIARGVVETKSGRLFTKLGTPVVAGSGYDDSMVVATPAMFGYRSEVFRSAQAAGDLLDRGQNNLYAVAERSYLIGFDDCGTTAVEVGEPTTVPEG